MNQRVTFRYKRHINSLLIFTVRQIKTKVRLLLTWTFHWFQGFNHSTRFWSLWSTKPVVARKSSGLFRFGLRFWILCELKDNSYVIDYVGMENAKYGKVEMHDISYNFLLRFSLATEQLFFVFLPTVTLFNKGLSLRKIFERFGNVAGSETRHTTFIP